MYSLYTLSKAVYEKGIKLYLKGCLSSEIYIYSYFSLHFIVVSYSPYLISFAYV